MNINNLVMALKEREKWKQTAENLSQKLEIVEKEIEANEARLRNLESELNKMRDMLQGENSNVRLAALKIGQEVR